MELFSGLTLQANAGYYLTVTNKNRDIDGTLLWQEARTSSVDAINDIAPENNDRLLYTLSNVGTPNYDYPPASTNWHTEYAVPPGGIWIQGYGIDGGPCGVGKYSTGNPQAPCANCLFAASLSHF